MAGTINLNTIEVSGNSFKEKYFENVPISLTAKAIQLNVTDYLGNMDFGLASTGDEVRLYDNLGFLVDSISFRSELSWPAEPNGNGPTLGLRH